MKILIYADNGKGIGLGHLTRCTSLAYKLKDSDHDILLIIKKDPSYQLNNKYSELQIEEISFSEQKILKIQKQFEPDLFIVDTYKFKYNFLLQIKKTYINCWF